MIPAFLTSVQQRHALMTAASAKYGTTSAFVDNDSLVVTEHGSPVFGAVAQEINSKYQESSRFQNQERVSMDQLMTGAVTQVTGEDRFEKRASYNVQERQI